MRSFNRIAVALVLTVLASLAFAQAKTHLVMWGGVPPESGPQLVVDAFNKEFAAKGYSMEYERFVNDEAGNLKLETNLLGGGDIDIFVTYASDKLAKRINSKMVLDISTLASRDKFDLVKNFGPLVKYNFVDGKPYAVPAQMALTGILLNKNMFDAAGIPVPKTWTFEEMRTIAKKLTKGEGDSKVYGMYFNSQQDIFSGYAWASQNLKDDPYYKPGAKETDLNNPLYVKAVQIESDMMNVDKSAPSHVDSVTQKLTVEGMFLSGKAAMSVGTWTVRSIKDLTKFPHDFMTAFAPIPLMSKTGEINYAGNLGDFICINPKSKNTEAAWEFVKWYTTKGVVYMAKYGRVPAYTQIPLDDVADSFLAGSEKVFDKESFKAVMLAARPAYAVQTVTTKLPEINKILIESIEAALIGKMTPKAALDDAKKRADAQLK